MHGLQSKTVYFDANICMGGQEKCSVWEAFSPLSLWPTFLPVLKPWVAEKHAKIVEEIFIFKFLRILFNFEQIVPFYTQFNVVNHQKMTLEQMFLRRQNYESPAVNVFKFVLLTYL